MRLNVLVTQVARHTGWSLEYIGQLPLRKFVALAQMLAYERQVEIYRIEWRIGQVLAAITSDKLHKHKPQEFIGEAPKLEEVTFNMTKEDTIEQVVLGDGKKYDLAVLDVNIMEAIEEEFDQAWDELLAHPRAKVIKAIVFHMLKASYPDLTRDQVGALLTTKILGKVTAAIAKMG